MNEATLGSKLLQAIHKETLMQSPLPLQVEAAQSSGCGQVLVSAEVVDGDRFSHVLGHFAAHIEPSSTKPSSLKPGSKLDAGSVARRLCERVGYLPEALEVVEAQPDESVLVRSSPPTMRGPGTDYFEAVVAGEGFELRRYTPREEGGRDEKAFCLPDDILSRLADDAAAILNV